MAATTSGEWTAADIPNLQGRRAIVTGANIGLGFQTARELARAGAQVVLACRSIDRGNAAAERIRAEVSGAQVFVAHLDLSSLASVRSFAAMALEAGGALDILVNNAGIMALPKRETSPDGFELQLATNYLGHYALTGLLLPLLLNAAAPRVVSLSSNAHKRGKLHFEDLQLEAGYTPWKSYSQTKLAMLVYARELQRQSDAHGTRLVSLAAHPGLSKTAINRDVSGPAKIAIPILFGLLGQSDAEGALPQLYAATAVEIEPGAYYGPDGFQEFKGSPALADVAPQAADATSGQQLWSASEALTHVTYDWTAGGMGELRPQGVPAS
ncbi:oxidoreductase [Acidipila sp. EB88]|uniref:oxidoreductase n=1 Tax=Acidipila sp. EB88 TaxID=2305226 RepID=UPI000F5EF69E|nr:oxidoreductase [Acidipila sp. EB88]RRA49074.1 SDR family NAD(P)-dependent oxidoreductase [Acidipila sp. EB88]